MTANEQQIQAIIIRMQKLEDAVKQCAPHPDNPGHRGFIYAKSDQRTSGDRDSMFGSLVADQILGCGLGMFSEEIVGDLDFGHFIDAYDEFWVDRRQSKENRARAAINSFNAARLGNKYKALEVAFEKDLPIRVQLERMYMKLSLELDKIESVSSPNLNINVDHEWKNDKLSLIA